MSALPFEEFDATRITELREDTLRNVTTWACECDETTASVMASFKELLRRSEQKVEFLESDLTDAHYSRDR